MLPSNVIKFVKKKKDAEKILQVFDSYTKKVKYPPLEVHQNMLLCLAVEYNHLELVKLLARRGTDVNFHVSKFMYIILTMQFLLNMQSGTFKNNVQKFTCQFMFTLCHANHPWINMQ